VKPSRVYLALATLCGSFVFITNTPLHAQQAAAPTAKRVSDSVNQQMPPWLRLNGEYRFRFEGLGGSAFRPDADDGYVLGRARVNTTIIPTNWMKLQFQGQDSQVWGRNPKPDAPPFEDTFDVRQAFVEFGNVESSKLGLRVGRQELFFGEQRLVGHLNWTNTARSFDAVRASYRRKDFRIDAFAASVVNLRDGAFNRRTDGNNLHGVYSSFSKIVPKATVEPYAFWRLGRGVRSESGATGKLDFKTVGLRWVGKLPANLDYGLEVAGQTGTLSVDDVRAFAGHWVFGYTLPKIKTTPRTFLEYNYASGDRNPTDGKRGTFDQLYPTGHDKIGLADQVGWRNVEHGRAGVELKPTAKLSMSGSYHTWWLANAHDGLYSASGALVARVANGTAGRRVGQEADVQAVYPLSPQMQLGVGYAHIFPGTFLKKATPGKPYNFSYMMLTYLF
jgi:Alginate export